MSKKLVLYSYYRSSCSWRVRIALALKKIDYEYKPINLLKDENVSKEFEQINPVKYVPALKIDDKNILVESLPIVEYIDETYKSGPALLPADPIKRATARSIASIISSGIQPLQNLTVLRRFKQDNIDEQLWAKQIIETKFHQLEKILEKTSNNCCVDNDITIADICLVPQVFNAIRFKVDMAQFKNINRIVEYLKQNDAFISTHPDNQPDCPK